MTPECGICGRPSNNALICSLCTGLLRADLAEVCAPRGLAYDLDIAVTRQTKFGPSSGSAGPADDAPLEYDDRASTAAIELREELVQWARTIHRDADKPVVGPVCARHRCPHRSCRAIRAHRVVPSATLPGIAAWLVQRVGWIARHPDAAEMTVNIRDAVRAARKATDRPVDRVYAGPCDCGADLYARADADEVVCRAPEHEIPPVWGIEERRVWLLRAAEDVLADGPTIARALSRLDVNVTPSRLRGYVHRGRLTPHWVSSDGRKVLFRVGDVLELVVPELRNELTDA